MWTTKHTLAFQRAPHALRLCTCLAPPGAVSDFHPGAASCRSIKAGTSDGCQCASRVNREALSHGQRLPQQHRHLIDLVGSVFLTPHHNDESSIIDEEGRNRNGCAAKKPLGRLVGAFKTASTNRIRKIRGTTGLVIWQRSFYEHIIRDERSLERIVAYIQDNPQDNPIRWETDPENPR